MAKVAKQETRSTLTAAEYWEWRNACTQVWNSNNKASLAEEQAKVLQLNAELAQMRLKLHLATSVKDARAQALECSQEYQKIKDVLEDKLGVSLNNKTIDDVTFEIMDAPKDS